MRRASTLQSYLIRVFLPFFGGALLFFVLLLEIIDLFANLWRYLALDVPLGAIARVVALYIPTCVSYGLPVALLFATAYTLGTLYARNELVAVFSGGVPLFVFVAPLIVFAAVLSVASFFFEDRVVLSTYREKSEYSRQLLQQSRSLSNSELAVIARDGKVVYRADYYDDGSASLSGLTVVERNDRLEPVARTEAAQAKWQDGRWRLSGVRRFERKGDGQWSESSFGSYTAPILDEPPESFRSQNLDVREMSLTELSRYVAFLKRAGLPSGAALAERQKRYAFSLAPLVVVFLSAALGGRFKKNVLLMSLLSSLLGATAYYIVQMVTMLMAKTGLILPAAGAWAPFFIFAILGAALFRRART
jgi:lipopolysaccharide export system permease protein